MPTPNVVLRTSLILQLAVVAVLMPAIAQAQTPSLVQREQGPLPVAFPAPAARPLGAAATGIVTSPPNFEKLRIQPGFLLHITVFNEPQLTQDLRVNETGDVSLALAGSVHVQGLNEVAAQDAIAGAYKKTQMLLDPRIELSILQYVSPKISVLGQVQSPGEYELIAPTDLLNAITMAGGATLDAGSRITLRHGATHEEEVIKFTRTGDTSNLQHFTVSAGDTIVVNRAGIVYVLGAVNRPGGYVMSPDGSLNVIQAIALALDTNFFAATQSVRIIRRVNDRLVDIPVKYKYIVAGKEEPVMLEPNDIVYVPNSKLRVTFVNVKQLAYQATGAAIYAGIEH